MLGKPNIEDRLVSLNIVHSSKATCALCNENLENIGHLFFSCNYSLKLWCSCLNKWKIDGVMTVEPRHAFESWLEEHLTENQRKKWCVCFLAWFGLCGKQGIR